MFSIQNPKRLSLCAVLALCAPLFASGSLASNVNIAKENEILLPCGSNLNIAKEIAVAKKPSTSTKPGQLQATQENISAQQQTANLANLIDHNVCDDNICVSLPAVQASIKKQLDCKVVGYAFFVGNSLTGPKSLFGAYGKARTSADAPAKNFAVTTKMQIASTSKVLTTLNAYRVLSSTMNQPAFTYFPPSWTLSSNSIVKQIAFRDFLSQSSGVMQYYASSAGQDYASMKTFFTPNLPNPNAAFSCPGPANSNATPPIPYLIPNPIISSKAKACYSNTNFGIMRVLLPRVAGSSSSNPQTLANAYVSEVQQNVFAPVGVTNVACKPPANGDYALLYKYPGTQAGSDWGDLTLSCGDWGWYVSVKDYASVLVSLNAQDGKILHNCELNDMEVNSTVVSGHPVGWDIKSDGAGHRWLEKNGGDGSGSGALQTTSVGIYGGKAGCVVKGKGTAPVAGVAAVLFINSTINGSNANASAILIKALQDATTPKP